MYGKSFKLWLLSGTVVATVPFLCGMAFAQETTSSDENTVQLDTISVEGQQSGTGPVNGYVATQTTTGMKTDVPITEIPQSVSVIGRDEIDDRKALKLDEVIRYSAGVFAAPYGNDPDTDWFYIRGFNATQTGVFLDNLSLASYAFGGFQIDPFMLERVEILKGPSSALYGGSNPGGLVNMISKRPMDDRFGYVEGGINNFGNAYFAFDINDVFGGRVGGNAGDPDVVGKAAPIAVPDNPVWAYRITGRLAGGDYYTDYGEDLRGTIMPQITYRPSEQTKINVYAQFSALDQTHTGNGFLPYVGTVVPASFGRIARDAFFGEPDLDNGRYTQFLLGYEFEHQFENDWVFKSASRYAYLNKHEIGPYPYGYAPGPFGFGNGFTPVAPDNLLYRIGFEGASGVDAFASDNNLSKKFSTGPVDHDVLVGVDYNLYNLSNLQASGGGTPISATDPIYGAAQGETFVYLDQELTQQQFGAYIQDQMRFGDGWIVTLNGRYDYLDVDSESPASLPFSPNYKSDDTAWTGRAGLGYEFKNGLTPYVSVSSFFNPVIGVSAVDDQGLKPEEGYQYEAGIKYEPTFMDALVTASVFEINRQNVLVADPLPPFLSRQLGEVRVRGFEIEGKANVTRNFRVLASLTVLDQEITEDLDPTLIGNTPMTVPDVLASAWADYKFDAGWLKGVSAGAGVRYIGSSWVDNANTLKVPSATVVDAAIRYDQETWGVALNVSNIFDEVYVSGCQGYSVCGYGDPRTITLSAHYKW
ncbi:iron complex outermembrane receptor protein [Ancylobacter sp. 3268]|uniref:TonB-dependent siderophore receptor n=1 Tax=Ancylobacter sp. 3268 TaxID=2817752 RepID=UPI0028652DF2|nr:TonB-dependent siderophore receptor [Ancylobacter sp. 3268]MDR6954991.1 iron complex outermembrane receptor protein [Ancylobacter sp. 3268]